MKYSQIVKITPALDELRKLHIPYGKARDIHRIYKRLETEFTFFAQEESKLVKKYAIKGENGEPLITENGFISFADMNAKKKYSEEIAKLNELETEISITPVTLTADEIGEQTMRPDSIDKLEGVIIFD